MAVVQLSRIQQRRGKRTDLPQLASGELGWAIDTQELFIGNGSVAEGAPAVGYTKILTSEDNLINNLGLYQYKAAENILTGPSASNPVQRSIQQKLDDNVTLNDFIDPDDTVTDYAPIIQRAVDQLFAIHGGENANVELRIPAGNYRLESTVFLPPWANIVGDGKGKTYFDAVADPAFEMRSYDTALQSYLNRGVFTNSLTESVPEPKNIRLEGMTIHFTSTSEAIRLNNTRDSVFRDITIEGEWTRGDDGIVGKATAPNADLWGIELALNGAPAYPVENNVFDNVEFNNLTYAVSSDDDIQYNKFVNCKVDNVGYGFLWGLLTLGGTTPGQATGPVYNTIENCTFTGVALQGIYIGNGQWNTSTNNKFKDVGVNSGTDLTPGVSVIYFAEDGNVSNNDFFYRTQICTVDPLLAYPPEVEGPKDFRNNFKTSVPVGFVSAGTQSDLIQFPTDVSSGKIEVYYDYKIRSAGDAVVDMHREGTLTLTYNKDTTSFILSDNYTIAGNDARGNTLVFYAFSDPLDPSKVIIKVDNEGPDGSTSSDELTFTSRHMA